MTEQVTRNDSFLFLAIFEGALREEGTFFFLGGMKRLQYSEARLDVLGVEAKQYLEEQVLKFYP